MLCILINRFCSYLNYLGPKPPPPPNPKLGKMIKDNKDKSKLKWGLLDLTDDDMATIAYYLLKDNKVS